MMAFNTNGGQICLMVNQTYGHTNLSKKTYNRAHPPPPPPPHPHPRPRPHPHPPPPTTTPTTPTPPQKKKKTNKKNP